MYEGLVWTEYKNCSTPRVHKLREKRRQADRAKARAIIGDLADRLPQQTIGKFLAAVEEDERLALEHWGVATGEVLTRLPREKRIAVEAWRHDHKVEAPDPWRIILRPTPRKARRGRASDWHAARNNVLQRLSHQMVHERRHEETNVFDYTGDGLYWHVRAMQA